MASRGLLLLFLSLSFFLILCFANLDDPARLVEEQGYLMREHSLGKPYQGRGMEVPFWEFGGTTVVSNEYIRLTPDRQSKRGSLWNTIPVVMHNWEILLQFAVHGSGKSLFGDGFAVWYTKDRNKEGPVFGNQDYFNGLGIFFDTYSNHNGEHAHDHPYISAMVSNGSTHYDHDRDGTHSQVAGCHAKFRNLYVDTYVSISYINGQLTVMYNFDESTVWRPCFFVDKIELPTGYYLGFTAVTGELADNHDIISVKVYDVSVKQAIEKESTAAEELDWSTVMPHANNQAPPRPHIEDTRPLLQPFWYRLFSMTMLIVLVVGIIAVIGGVAWKKQQEKNQKRFF